MNIPKRFKKAIRLLNKYYIENNIEEKKKKCCTIEREFKLLEQQYQKLENPWKDPKIELPNDELKYYCIKEVNSNVYLSIWNKIEKRWYYHHCNYSVSTGCVIAWMEIPVIMRKKEEE